MVVHGRISIPLPPLVQGIKRKSWLKLLGIIFQENPSDWDLHVDNLLRKASSRLYILRVCKYFGYPKEQLTKLFDLLIMSLFLYGIEIWGAAYQGKYLDRIDKFFKRAFRFGYTSNLYAIAEVIRNRDCKLWNTITDTPSHPLYQLLPPKKQRFLRNRGHDFILPAVKQNALRDLLLIGVFLILFSCLYLILNRLHCHVSETHKGLKHVTLIYVCFVRCS